LEERRTGHHFTLHDTRRFLIGPWNIAGIISGVIRVVLQTTSTAAEASSFTFADLFKRKHLQISVPGIDPGKPDFQISIPNNRASRDPFNKQHRSCTKIPHPGLHIGSKVVEDTSGGGVDIIQQMVARHLIQRTWRGSSQVPAVFGGHFLGQGEAYRMRGKYPVGYEMTHSKGGLDNNPGVAETAPHRTISHARGNTRTRTHTHTPTRKYVIKERRALLAHPAPPTVAGKVILYARHVTDQSHPHFCRHTFTRLRRGQVSITMPNTAQATHPAHSHPRPPPITNFQSQNPSSTRVPWPSSQRR
jgi:hypothetical protein